jgi:glycerol-3-phosphate dehydrogenase (NAD(P)+)
MKVLVAGAGAWGTAMAVHLASRHQVTLWARDPAQASFMQADRKNQRYLPGVTLPSSLSITSDLEHSVRFADSPNAIVLLATPVAGLTDLLTLFGSLRSAAVVNLSKGLSGSAQGDAPTLLPHQLYESLRVSQQLPLIAPFASLSGPSFAAEVVQGLPTAMTVASSSQAAREAVVTACHHDAVRVYRNDDIIGVELAGALKNVIAIAAGACDGLNLGMNARAALITRGLAEIARLGSVMGARSQTFAGLAGMGDMLLTCTGALSRNRELGFRLAQGQTLEQIQAQLGHVAEGVNTAKLARKLSVQAAQSAQLADPVALPIITAVSRVLFDGLPAQQAIISLLERSPKDEY